jgi:drug/metabolite transporter (DMT)-like permease
VTAVKSRTDTSGPSGARPSGARPSGARHGGAGLSIAVLSAATFGTSGTFASSLIDAGWSPAAAVTARVATAAVLLTVPALLALRKIGGGWVWSLRATAWRVIAYGLIGVAGCQFCYFNALQRMPVGVALLLEYLGAVLVVGWLWVRHGQRPRRLTVAGSVTAVTGLVLVLNLTGSGHIDPVGVMWGLLAAVSLAIYFVLSAAGGEGGRAGSDQAAPELPPVVMAWGGMCVGAAALGLLGWSGAVPMHATTRDVELLSHHVTWVVPVLGVALLATVVGYVTGIRAARLLGAKLASFVSMSEVLFAICYAWILLHQLPSAIQFLGGAFIFTGVALVRIDELGSRASAQAPGQDEPDGVPERVTTAAP